MKIHLITATNGRYLEHMRPYLDSIEQCSQVPATLVCVGFRPPEGHWARGYRRIALAWLAHEANYGAPGETESPQHGAWLKAVEGISADVCIFTDGDLVMQRPFS